MTKKIKSSNSALIELEDNFIHIRFNDMSIIGLDEAKQVADDIIELCNGTAYPFITNGLGITIRMNKNARDFFASYEPLVKIRRGQAILVNNTPSKLLANFFIKYHKPANPTKIFTKMDDALIWIKTLP
jgi:hypothetical protein